MRRSDLLLRASIVPCLLGASPVLAEGRWYAGDLHAHSLHSDGDSPVADIISKAESVGLDFFVITDHDSSMAGEPLHWEDPDYRSDQLILLYGVEWTNRVGHANVWSDAPFDYRAIWAANLIEDPWAAAEAAHEQGALFSINHPTNYTCCAWRPDEGMNDAVEVWNGYHRAVTWDYGATHLFWEEALKAGRRVTAVGGSDMHYLAPPTGNLFTVGNPTTWVFAYDASPTGIIEAMAAGRASISYGPDAPRVELWADEDLDGSFETAMGESIGAGAGRLQVKLGDAAGGVEPVPLSRARAFFGPELSPSDLMRLRAETRPTACGSTYLIGLYEGERLKASSRVACGGTWTVDVQARSGSFYRVEVLGSVPVDPKKQAAYGYYVALSNPIRVE